MTWRLWGAGTSRILSWSDPERYGVTTHLYDSPNWDVQQPLATKMEAQRPDLPTFDRMPAQYRDGERDGRGRRARGRARVALDSLDASAIDPGPVRLTQALEEVENLLIGEAGPTVVRVLVIGVVVVTELGGCRTAFELHAAGVDGGAALE